MTNRKDIGVSLRVASAYNAYVTNKGIYIEYHPSTCFYILMGPMVWGIFVMLNSTCIIYYKYLYYKYWTTGKDHMHTSDCLTVAMNVT